MTLEEIQEQMREGQLTPHQMSEFKTRLAGEYSHFSEQLEDVLLKKPSVWMEMRKSLKSDTSTDRAWDGTEMGLIEMKLRLRCKRIEKLISALSSALRVKEGEARNEY